VRSLVALPVPGKINFQTWRGCATPWSVPSSRTLFVPVHEPAFGRPLSGITTAQLEEWERRYSVPLIQIWGMTETMSLPGAEPVCGPRKSMSMGMAIYGYELRVVDPTGKEVAPGTVGELVVHGAPRQ
jgi:acyl-CoA synthetase (AMP-forming)/AMP-acid ligase II